MVNQIKESGTEGLALQITKPARAAELVEENSEGAPTSLADVRVYSFQHMLLVVDVEAVAATEIAELALRGSSYTVFLEC
jgi:hypothetical protein